MLERQEELHADIEWDTYANMLDELENAREMEIDNENLNYDDKAWDEDLDLLRRNDEEI